jgi:hypothetical protein
MTMVTGAEAAAEAAAGAAFDTLPAVPASTASRITVMFRRGIGSSQQL